MAERLVGVDEAHGRLGCLVDDVAGGSDAMSPDQAGTTPQGREGSSSRGQASTLAVASLALSLAGLMAAMGSPVTVMLGAGAGVAGVVCGMSAYRRGDEGGTSVSGVIFGVLAVLLALVFA